MRRIGEFLTRYKAPVEVQDSVTYKQVTIRTNYNGVVLRGTKLGADIGTKKQWEVSAGQFILSRIDARNGAFGIIPEDLEGAIVTNDFLAFDINENEVEREFFNVFLQSPTFLGACVKASRGNTNRKRVNEDFFLDYQVNLPPLEEQHELIAKIDAARSSVEIAQKEIDYQHSLLAKLQDAILHEAVRGKLTTKWRETNKERDTARQLLERISAEKARLLLEKEIRKGKHLSEIAPEEIPFDIPARWEWERLGNLCSKTGSGSTPAGGKSAYTKSGIPFLRSQNVYDTGLILDDVANIPPDIHRRMKNTTVHPNDLLLNITGGSIGRCALVRDEISEANVNQHVAIIRPVLRPLEVYLHSVITSPYFQQTILDVQTGAGREGLPKGKMDLIPIPIPPLDEQSAIAKRVQALMSACRELDCEIADSRANAERLLDAVLNGAFSIS